MKLKLLFENELVIEIIVKPEWKQKLCVIVTLIVKINYISSVASYLCNS